MEIIVITMSDKSIIKAGLIEHLNMMASKLEIRVKSNILLRKIFSECTFDSVSLFVLEYWYVLPMQLSAVDFFASIREHD